MKILLLILSLSSLISYSQDSTSFKIQGSLTMESVDGFSKALIKSIREPDFLNEFVLETKDLIPKVPDTMLTILELHDPKDWNFDPKVSKQGLQFLHEPFKVIKNMDLIACKLAYEGDQFYDQFNFGILFGTLTYKLTADDSDDYELIKFEIIAFQVKDKYYLIELDYS